ncbi:MAG TPA: ABC transporter ATP-binding protein [Pseudomonas xinjiangensis]|uniref:ABC transporter ATP-binding protein n=2 Tax=root TaxID=1 RepID=A0A7V1FSG5_9GAMM|nr:ABC transporter ATP-binding protein [Halopseudomonas xinjiangensis]HEC48581.1 ABC transporter ATP-binding protein [Halopseudomonas xinjiangensis]
MSLTLENVSRVVDGVPHLSDVNITFEPGSFNVLLGRTLAGKTSLMRLMAGLDRPTAGRLLMDGEDVTGKPVQRRNVSMVYQQFINFPGMTVRENIASPLRIARMKDAEIGRRVAETAAMLRIEPLLDRYPLELSGGQQQRTAMARALVKDASLILFDEPLVNLDYKLREELRVELRELFRERNAIAVYASTEPNEALALGGATTLLHEGRIIQSGPGNHVYRQPVNIHAAELFSEPPINLINGRLTENEINFDDYAFYSMIPELASLPPGNYSFGVRPSHLGLVPRDDDDLEFAMQVELAEISGSETFLHVRNEHFNLVLQLSGVHAYRTDTPIKVYLPIHKLFVFSVDGDMVQAPAMLNREQV